MNWVVPFGWWLTANLSLREAKDHSLRGQRMASRALQESPKVKTGRSQVGSGFFTVPYSHLPRARASHCGTQKKMPLKLCRLYPTQLDRWDVLKPLTLDLGGKNTAVSGKRNEPPRRYGVSRGGKLLNGRKAWGGFQGEGAIRPPPLVVERGGSGGERVETLSP